MSVVKLCLFHRNNEINQPNQQFPLKISRSKYIKAVDLTDNSHKNVLAAKDTEINQADDNFKWLTH